MQLIKNIALIIFSSILPVVLFLLVDLYIGFSGISYDSSTCDSCEKNEKFAEGWYELKPNMDAEIFHKFTNISYRVITNEHRFRVGDGVYGCSSTSSEQCTDLLFLGDSYTFGVNGDWEDTFVGMIASDAVRFNVVNGGNESYSIAPYNYVYQRFLRTRDSDEAHLVVIAVDLSDVQDEAGNWKDGADHPVRYQWRLDQDRKYAESNPGGYFNHELKAYLPYTHSIWGYFKFGLLKSDHFVYDRVAFTHKDWELLNQTHPTDGYLPLGVSGGIARVESGLRELLREIERNNGEAIVLIYPWPNQMVFEDTHFDWSQFIHTICEEEICSGVIDLFPVMREHKKNHPTNWYTDLYVTGDTHFNTKGNKLIADHVLQFLDSMKGYTGDSQSSR